MLRRARSAAIRLLRAAREAALRLASRGEPWFDAEVRRGELPPLWLRRHAGPTASFLSSARQAVDQLRALGLLRAGSAALDLGCGPGAMALALRAELGAAGTYLGLDVHGPSLDWCAGAFRADPRYRFLQLAVPGSPYFRAARAVPSVALDALGRFDLVLAKSLATHLLPLELARLLGKLEPRLAAGGRLVMTAFLFDAGSERPIPLLPHRSPRGRVRWRRRDHPRAAIGYDRAFLGELLARRGLVATDFVAGFWPGEAAHPTGQDTLVLRRAAEV